jgi:class 3 adenylate cyclase
VLSKMVPKAGSAQVRSATGPPAPIRREDQPREGPAGERRHLTVLFCDLAGSTAIAAQLDREEWRETVGGYHRAAAEAITRCVKTYELTKCRGHNAQLK